METKTVKHNPVVFYLQILVYTLIAIVLRVIATAPLAALVVDTIPAWAALLCPVLWIFVIMPLRFSFGDAMAQGKAERVFDYRRAFSFAEYGEKLTQSLLHALHVAKWGLPLALMGVLAFYWYNEVDALTVLQTVTAMGRFTCEATCAVANLFGAGMTVPANTLMEGVFTVLGIVGLGAAVWALGVVRNSATRYIWSIAPDTNHKLAVEVRRRLLGRRWAQLAVGLVNLLLMVPAWIVALLPLKDVFSSLSTKLMMAITTGAGFSGDLSGTFLPIAVSFCVLYLLVLPIRRWLTASFAVHESGRKVQTAPEA